MFKRKQKQLGEKLETQLRTSKETGLELTLEKMLHVLKFL